MLIKPNEILKKFKRRKYINFFHILFEKDIRIFGISKLDAKKRGFYYNNCYPIALFEYHNKLSNMKSFDIQKEKHIKFCIKDIDKDCLLKINKDMDEEYKYLIEYVFQTKQWHTSR